MTVSPTAKSGQVAVYPGGVGEARVVDAAGSGSAADAVDGAGQVSAIGGAAAILLAVFPARRPWHYYACHTTVHARTCTHESTWQHSSTQVCDGSSQRLGLSAVSWPGRSLHRLRMSLAGCLGCLRRWSSSGPATFCRVGLPERLTVVSVWEVRMERGDGRGGSDVFLGMYVCVAEDEA